MKIFISWSGERSRLVAELLNSWIKCVIQASKPWISTQDIESGSTWFNEISNELNDASVGVICLTKENKNNPWILFESGALAKGLEMPRVCTFLVDLDHVDIKPPLSQFNHTLPEQDSMWKLVKMINARMDTARLDDGTLASVFNTYWLQFQEAFNDVITETESEEKQEARTKDDMLEEILETSRILSKRMSYLERKSKPPLPRAKGTLGRVVVQDKEYKAEDVLVNSSTAEIAKLIAMVTDIESHMFSDEERKKIADNMRLNLQRVKYMKNSDENHSDSNDSE